MKINFSRYFVFTAAIFLIIGLCGQIAFAEQLIFDEQFNNNKNNWYEVNNDMVQLYFQNNAYRMISKSEKQGYMTWLRNPPLPKSGRYAIELTISLVKGTPAQGFGLGWDIKDTQTYYKFLVTQNKHFKILKFQEGRQSIIKDWTQATFPDKNQSKSFILAVGQDSNKRTSFFINEIMVYSCMSLPINFPGIGIVAGPQMIVDINQLKIVKFEDQAGKKNEDSPYLLGVNMREINSANSSFFALGYKTGIEIVGIVNGSDAERAGIQAGDIIVSVQGNAVEKISDMMRAVKNSGGILTIGCVRNGKAYRKRIKLTPIKQSYTAGPSTAPPAQTTATIKQGISIHRVQIKPSPVPPGGKFSLNVEYTIADASASLEQLPFTLNYQIVQDGKVMLERSAQLQAPNGKHHIATKSGLKAARNAGEYEVLISLHYKNKFAGDAVPLIIK